MTKKIRIFCLLLVMLFLVSCTIAQEQIKESAVKLKTKQMASVKDNAMIMSSDFYTVVISDEQFMPSSLVIKRGDTVQWVNKDNQSHTITFQNNDFDELLPPGGTLEYQFPGIGNFYYQSILGPEAQGIIIVQ